MNKLSDNDSYYININNVEINSPKNINKYYEIYIARCIIIILITGTPMLLINLFGFQGEDIDE